MTVLKPSRTDPVRMKAFGDPRYPNWTVVGVNRLAGFDFEIRVIARLPT